MLSHIKTGPVKSQFFLSFWRPTFILCEGVAMDTSKSQFFLSFGRPTSISCERVGMDTSKSQFFLSFWRPTSISCERVAPWHLKSQFFFSFWRPTSISCERVAPWHLKSQFFLSFWRPTSISCERVAPWHLKSQFFLIFWRPTSISCERVAAGQVKSQFFLSFWRPFVRKGCVSWRSGGTAPALRENRKKSERRSADVKVWRCRSADVRVWRCRSAGVRMWRCRSADVRVWRCRSADVRVWRCRSADVRVWRCRSADVRVWRCRSAGVRMWRCRSADVKVWRCRSADVRVWRCRSADVRVWRCRSADVKEWRCSITAAFLRRTLRRRSREKVTKRRFSDLNKQVPRTILHRKCNSWSKRQIKYMKKLLSPISKPGKQSKRTPSNDENPRTSIYSNALIVGKHLVKWSAILPVPRTCPICKIYFAKSSLNQFTLMSMCLDLRWRSVPSKRIFPSEDDIGYTWMRGRTKLKLSQQTDGFLDSCLNGNEFCLTWTQCHRCLMSRKTLQNDTSKNNHTTSNASPLRSLQRGKSSITIHFQTDVLLRKVLKSRWGKFLGHLHVQSHETKNSPQGFLMAWLWTRLSSRQHGNQDQDILSGLSQPWQTSKNSPELGVRLSADRLFWQCLLQKWTKIRKWSGTFGDSILFECTVQIILIDKQLQTRASLLSKDGAA